MNDTFHDVIALTQALIGFDTVNQPGQEAAIMAFVAEGLREAGFDCTLVKHAKDRASLIATKGTGMGLPLCFSGHLDTVPLGLAPWARDPFGGAIEDGRLYGRGGSDMKGGVAAFVTAAIQAGDVPGGIALVLTAGEETGSDGARWLTSAGHLPKAGALVIAEPTGNRALAGHKGALWLRLVTRGVTAHGSTPHLGENAILKMGPTLDFIGTFDPDCTHPVMGAATVNLGTISGGLNTNSVPDRCEATVDLRSVPGIGHADLRARIQAGVGPDVTIEPIIDLPSVWTDPEQPWLARTIAIAADIAGTETSPAAAAFFTDASILTPAMGMLPTVILGPGEPDMAHKTDEYVRVSRLHEAVEIYGRMLDNWQGRAE